jgi:hypothetical protein
MADFTLSCPRCGKAFAIRNRQAGQRYLCPHCRQPFSLRPAGDAATPAPASVTPAPAPRPFSPDELLADPPSVIPKRSKRAPLRLFGPAGFFAAILCLAVLFIWDRLERRANPGAGVGAGAGSNAGVKNRPRETRKPSRVASANGQRQPVQLLLAPAGARIVIHLRPARLWTPIHCGLGDLAKKQARTWSSCELRLCLPELTQWAGEQIEDWCLYPPSQIDEAVFSFTLRSPDEPPDVTALVRLLHPAGPSEVANRFGGTRAKKSSLPVFRKGRRVLVVRDPETFAVGPAEFAEEMVEARDQPNPTDAAIEELLKETDRARDLTVVFRPDDLDRFRSSLVSAPWADAARQLATWLDPDAVEGAFLSVRFDDPFRVRLVARARPVVYPPRLAETLKGRLDHLPTDLLSYVERMQPSVPGSRKLIGRLPAMCKAVALGADVDSQGRMVTLESVLPERAAPNLSLATYLVLTEGPTSLVRAPAAPVVRHEGPKTLVARLQTVVDVDFRRTPLSEAFESIGGDIGVTFELDGGALKLAGYTKNIPQTFQIKGAPAAQSLQKILKAYPKLALVADEPRRTIVVTTAEAAAAQKKTPMSLGK